MKDGLECDARILRMRYSSQNWVSSLAMFLVSVPGRLRLTHLELAQRALSSVMAPDLCTCFGRSWHAEVQLAVCGRALHGVRWPGLMQVPEGKEQVIKPERVLVLAKSMRVRWRQLDAHLQGGVTSLDDLMRIDLHYITRHATCVTLSLNLPKQTPTPPCRYHLYCLLTRGVSPFCWNIMFSELRARFASHVL